MSRTNTVPSAQPSVTVKNDLLVSLLQQDAVPMETLHQRYGSLLELVRILIGVVPNCDKYLEIWPTAFRSYNLIVPNFLNLPFSIFGVGKAPKEMVGLAMYVASRSAECPYCTAHTCSFALRRGADPDVVAKAFTGSELSPKQLATVDVARSLARVPTQINATKRTSLQKHYTAVEIEWIVLGISMMGFLNKFMDAIGVDLEAETVAETRNIIGSDWTPGSAGWALADQNQSSPPPASDSLKTRLSVIKYAPAALKLDKAWQIGVPDKWPQVGEFLHQHTGYHFPVLAQLTQKRGIRAIATVLRDNLDESNSVVGIETKLKAAIVFTTSIGNTDLRDEIQALIVGKHITDIASDLLIEFATNPALEIVATKPAEYALLKLVQAISPSPARVNQTVVDDCSQAGLSSAAIVETVTWISVLQMLHRISSYYPPANDKAD